MMTRGAFAGLRTAPKMSTTSRRISLDSAEMDAQTGMRSSTHRDAGNKKIFRRIAAMGSPRRSQAYTAETAPNGMAHWEEAETFPVDGPLTRMFANGTCSGRIGHER